MTSLLVALFVLLFMGAVSSIIAICVDEEELRIVPVCAIIVIFFIVGITTNKLRNFNEPKAIDVYENKTDLKVNYEVVNNDTIVTDSVVVYKPEFKK